MVKLERVLAGIKDIRAKSLRSNNPINVTDCFCLNELTTLF